MVDSLEKRHLSTGDHVDQAFIAYCACAGPDNPVDALLDWDDFASVPSGISVFALRVSVFRLRPAGFVETSR